MKNMKNYSNESGYTVCPTTKEELKEIIKKTIKEKDNKCDLNFIDTSKITDMSFLFSPGGGGFNKFNGDISKWDVKGDCNVSNMFSDSSLEYKAPKWYYDIRSDVEYYD